LRYASATPAEGTEGEIEAQSLWAGQSVALAKRVEPAAEIVRELVSRLQA
jgi:NAD(P)H-dependent flavin oxidoreductase YrpB (nitropropane dioxygenase family)